MRMFGRKRDKVTGEWRRLHNEGLNDLYSLPNNIWVIRSRGMRWVRCVAHMGERRGVYRDLMGNLRERDHLEDPGIDGMIILRWIFRKWAVGEWTGSVWLRMGTAQKQCLLNPVRLFRDF